MVEDFPFIQVCPETIRDGLEKLLNMSRSELLNLENQVEGMWKIGMILYELWTISKVTMKGHYGQD